MMLQRELGRSAVKANGRSAVARLRPVAGRRHVAFQGARPSVRVYAEAPVAGSAAKAPAIKLEEVKEGVEYQGTVADVQDFGAFVNFGTTTNGLVHISKLQAGFTKNPKDVVSAGDVVTVKVLSVDAAAGRVSLELVSGGKVSAASAAPSPQSSVDDEEQGVTTEVDRDAEEEEEVVEVELEEGQVEIYAELPGFDDIPFVMDEDNADELTEQAVSAMEQDLESVQIEYRLEAPAYMQDVTGKVTRIEDYGVFVEFAFNGKQLTGLLPKDEMKVPSSVLSADAQAALRAEWVGSGYDMPAYVELPEDELDVKKYFQPGQEVTAFVLESALVDNRGISLTMFTDEEVAADAVDAYEGLDEDEDEELDKLLTEALGLEDEVLAFDPESLIEDEEDAAAGLAADSSEYEGVSQSAVESAMSTYDLGVTRSGLIKGKSGYQMAPMGLPSRPVDGPMTSTGLAILATHETDFDGDEVQLMEYWNSEAYDNIPKDVLKRVAGLKMKINEETGEAEFEAKEGVEPGQLPLFLFNGDVDERAKEFVADLLEEDEDEAELPARAYRRPAVFAAAVQS